MTGNVKLTIIVPTFNCASTVSACAHSILRQTCRDFEVIFADGGSTDGTLAILREACRGRPNAVIHSHPDAGIYDGMNKAMARSRGEWLLFLGGDDALHDPDTLARFLPLLTANRDIVYGDVLYQTASGERRHYGGAFTPRKLARRNICHQSMFYRASLFSRFGAYDQKYAIFADWAFNLRVFPRTRNLYVPGVVAVCGSDGASSHAPDPAFHGDRLDLMVHNTPVVIHPIYANDLPRLLRLWASFVRRRKIRKAAHVSMILAANLPVRVLRLDKLRGGALRALRRARAR
jgi:glycosyltransferase involved in cell wall biosynthesis